VGFAEVALDRGSQTENGEPAKNYGDAFEKRFAKKNFMYN
jgi:hypothetical protein